MPKANRFDWIDIARGLGVFFVVIVHLGFTGAFKIVPIALCAFTIPLFFVISGFLYKAKPGFKKFALTKTKRLLIPSAVFVLFGIAVYSVTTGWSYDSLGYLFFWNGLIPFNNPTWFFIVLFEVYLIEYIFNGFRKTMFRKLLLACGFFVLGYLIYVFQVFLPFGLDKAVVACGFFNIGEVTREIFDRHGSILREKPWRKAVFLIPFLALYVVFGLVLNYYKVSFYHFEFGNYWCFIVSGISGSIATFTLCSLVEKLKVFDFFKTVGTNSVFIVGTHNILTKAFKAVAGHFGSSGSLLYVILATGFAVLMLKAYEPICSYLDKRAPWLTGKMK